MSKFFENKTVLIISSDKWGAMYISKHHYAIELTTYCRKVFFLNPADTNLNSPFLIEKHNAYENLFIVSYRPFFSSKLRFRLRFLFDILMKYQVAKLLKGLNEPIDIAWCYNRYAYANLNWFKAKTRIYHPVDQVSSDRQVMVGNSATVIFTVSDVILDRFKLVNVPRYIINHGLSQYFSKLCDINNVKPFGNSRKLKVGYIGNLFLSSLDRMSFKRIVENNHLVEFHIWGPNEITNSNVGGDASQETQDFISFLRLSQNVILQGVKSPRELAVSIQEIDAFFVCLDIEKDPNLGSNSHKIMEYLSTGKVIISKAISMYENEDDLIAMADQQTSIVELFGEVIKNIEFYNSEELQLRRKEFALRNTYKKQIQRISNILSGLKSAV